MTSNGRDPFPLFHLAPLNFPCSPEAIPSLPSYQLALAPFSSEWDEKLEPLLKSIFRRRRERVRDAITSRAPTGVYSSIQERQREVFPKFEMIDLTFDLKDLETLTSAQLAAIVFHPESSKEIMLQAEDIFFRRRERDLGVGLTTPNVDLVHPPSPILQIPRDLLTSSSTTSTSDRHHHSRRSHSTRFSSPPFSPTNEHERPSSKQDPPLPMPPKAGSSSSTGHASTSRSKESSRTHRKSPEPSIRESKRDPRHREDESEKFEEERKRRRSSRGDDEAKGKGFDRGIKCRKEKGFDREKQREEDIKWEKERDLERQRERDEEVERKERRQKRGKSDRDPRGHAQEGDKQETRSRRRKRSLSPESLKRDERVRRRRDETSMTEPPPSSSKENVDDQKLRKNDEEDVTMEKHEPNLSQPSISNPDPSDSIPPSLQRTFSTLFIRYFPPGSTVRDIFDFVDEIVPGLRPLAVRLVEQTKPSPPSSVDRQGYRYAFAAFEKPSEAQAVIERGDRFVRKGLSIAISHAKVGQVSGLWTWEMLPDAFVRKWHQEEATRLGAVSKAPTSSDFPLQAPSPFSARARLCSATIPQAATSSQKFNTPTSVSASTPSSRKKMGSLPQHLKDELWELFVDNLPSDATIRACRDFFDEHEGLVGVALPPQDDSATGQRFCWIAFSTKKARSDALARLCSTMFPGAPINLFAEPAEVRGRTERPMTHHWTWNQLSKEYQDSHNDEYSSMSLPPSRSDASLPVRPLDPRSTLAALPQKPSSLPSSGTSASVSSSNLTRNTGLDCRALPLPLCPRRKADISRLPSSLSAKLKAPLVSSTVPARPPSLTIGGTAMEKSGGGGTLRVSTGSKPLSPSTNLPRTTTPTKVDVQATVVKPSVPTRQAQTDDSKSILTLAHPDSNPLVPKEDAVSVPGTRCFSIRGASARASDSSASSESGSNAISSEPVAAVAQENGEISPTSSTKSNNEISLSASHSSHNVVDSRSSKVENRQSEKQLTDREEVTESKGNGD